MKQLPEEILQRAQRVLKYHQACAYDGNKPKQNAHLDTTTRPATHRTFSQAPKVPLSTTLLDAGMPAVAVLENGREALPDSMIAPPQDLKTLSTWLYMSDGMIPVRHNGKLIGYDRTCPSSEGTSPCEIYVAAFAIDGLEPGLYDFSAKEYALRKIRDGYEALSLLKRGRPDLEFLKTTPGVILISTLFARSSWRFGLRGYRQAIHDAGQLMENITFCGNALGVQTMTRMRLTDSTSRELIGVPPDASYDDAEAVQAMVIWADPAVKPMKLPEGMHVVEHLPPLARPAPVKPATPFPQLLEAHSDCVAPGVAIREIRPPLTELNPMPGNAVMVEKPMSEEPTSQSVMRTLTTHRSARDFHPKSIPRNAFLALNRAAFRGGSHFPLFPDGPQVALIRPFWVIHSVTGIDTGVWYYHPSTDKWTNLDRGEHRMDSAYLAYEQPRAGHASAICFLFAAMSYLMQAAGPDLYRLAHLEAGMVSQRLYVAANALGFASATTGEFYDEELRKFLGLAGTGWQPVHAVMVGVSVDEKVQMPQIATLSEADVWRD